MEKIEVAPGYPAEKDVNITEINLPLHVERQSIYICKNENIIASVFKCSAGIMVIQLGYAEENEEPLISPMFAFEEEKGMTVKTPFSEVNFEDDFEFIGVV